MGYTIGFGALPAQIIAQVPMTADMSPMIAALSLFIAGSAALVLVAFILLALGFQIGAWRKQRLA